MLLDWNDPLAPIHISAPTTPEPATEAAATEELQRRRGSGDLRLGDRLRGGDVVGLPRAHFGAAGGEMGSERTSAAAGESA